MFGIFARGRLLARPSIDRFMIARNSPLQFIWFGGLISGVSPRTETKRH
jgi:hypothetical protein